MTKRRELQPSDLPEPLRQIAEIADIEAAMRVGRFFSGRPLLIPRVVTRDHTLAQLVGPDNASRIASHLGGAGYDVPAVRALTESWFVRSLLDKGKTVAAIVNALGLKRRRVLWLLFTYDGPGSHHITRAAARRRVRAQTSAEEEQGNG